MRDKRRREKNKKRLYSGSIHSASTAGPGGNVLPEHGEVMYGGMRNDGKYNTVLLTLKSLNDWPLACY